MKTLTINVDGREALPVRALAYVTGWTLSPDAIAENLAKKTPNLCAKLKNTVAYHLHGGEPIEVLPKEWDGILAKIEGLASELQEKYPTGNQAYADWRARVISKLPEGVFVWLDEFEKDFFSDFRAESVTFVVEREGDRDLNYKPMITADEREMVLCGFQPNAVHESPQLDANVGPGANADSGRPNSKKTTNSWGEYELRRLLEEYREVGSTHEKLAQKHGVTRQRIGKLLKEANSQLRPQRAGLWDTSKQAKNKK